MEPILPSAIPPQPPIISDPTPPSAPPVPPVTPPEPPIISPQPPQKKSFTWLIILVILFLLASTGVLAYQYYQLKTQTANITPSPSLAPSPTLDQVISPELTAEQDATLDPTANWKTYTYQIFTIKLPPNWSTTDVKNPVQFLNYVLDPKSGGSFNPSTDKGKLKVEIYQNNSSDSLESYLAQQKSSAIEARGKEIDWQETKEIVAGKEAIRVKTTTPGYTYNFKDISSNTIFSIAFGLDFDNYKELSDLILSTFKFTN